MSFLAFGYVPLMAFLLWLRIRAASEGEFEESVPETELEKDSRWRRFFGSALLATALWSPIATIIFAIELMMTFPLLLLLRIPPKTYFSFFAYLNFLVQRLSNAAHAHSLWRMH
jgi:hypothetical protein